MEDLKAKAEERAAAVTSVSLSIRSDLKKDGLPRWYASWRPAPGAKPVYRTVGVAWVESVAKSNNTFVRKADDAERAKHVGSARWRIDWRERGRRAKAEKDATGALTLHEAETRAREMVVEDHMKRLRTVQAIKRAKDPRTFAQVCGEWVTERRADAADGLITPSTLDDYEGMLRAPREVPGKGSEPRAWVIREFGARKPSEITGADLDAFMDKLRDEGLTERTRSKYGTVLRMVFDFARRKGWIEHDPCADRAKRKRSKRRRKVLEVYSPEQVESVARRLDTQTGEVIRLAAYTGLRLGELLALKWGDIDWTVQAVHVRASWDYRAKAEGPPKSGDARSVPLGQHAREVLERVNAATDATGARDLVFPGVRTADGTTLAEHGHMDPSALRRRYNTALVAAQEEDAHMARLVIHDLRHTFGSRLAAGGVPLTAIQQYMGHSDIQTTAIYLHFVPRTDAAAEVTRALSFGSPASAQSAEAVV